MSLMKLILDTMKRKDIRRAAMQRPDAAAKHYRIPEHRLADYLKMMGEG